MADIRIINVTNLSGIWTDWLLKPTGRLDETEELVNIVKLSLMTWSLADVDDILPDLDSDDRHGWWGDFEAETIWDGWPIGSKLWLLSRAKIAPAEAREGSTLARAENYCRVALQPLIDRRICTRFDVEAARNDIGRIDVVIRVYRGPDYKIDLRFQNLWDEIRN